MTSVPFEKWDGVSAYYTFADQPTTWMGSSSQRLSSPACRDIGAKHELDCYRKVDDRP